MPYSRFQRRSRPAVAAPRRYQGRSRYTRRVRRTITPAVNAMTRMHSFKRGIDTYKIPVPDRQATAAWSFRLDYLPNYTEFTSLYDQYKINMVVGKIGFSKTGPTGGVELEPATACIPNFHWAIDYNDGTAPVNVSELVQYDSHRVASMVGDRKTTVIVRPCFLRQNYATLIATGYSPVRGWINCSDPTVTHYGIKIITDGSLGGGIGEEILGVMTVDWTYYISCKNTK